MIRTTRTTVRTCGVADCPKGGTHREPYQATCCRLYAQYYQTSRAVRTRTLLATVSGPPSAAWPVPALQALAKSRGLRGVRRLSKTALLAVLT